MAVRASVSPHAGSPSVRAELGTLTSELKLIKHNQRPTGTTSLGFTARLTWPPLLEAEAFSRNVAAWVPGRCSKAPLCGGPRSAGTRTYHVFTEVRHLPPPCNSTSWVSSGDRDSFIHDKSQKCNTLNQVRKTGKHL